MKLTVVVDQPWLVPADVLVVPIGADPAFDGPLGELDRRSGGELSTLRAFGELSGKKYSTAMAASGKVRAGRLLTVGVGPVAKVDRETVVRMAAAAERRLGGRKVRSVAVWLGTFPAVEGGLAGVAEAETLAGSWRARSDPATIYRDKVDLAPPVVEV